MGRVGIASPPAVLLPDGMIITPDICDAERLQGFNSNWTRPAEEVGRASLRWSLVGNAISVPVAKWLGCRLLRPGRYDHNRDHTLAENRSWPKAARFDGIRRSGVEIGMFPVWKKRPPLTEFLRYPGRPL